MAIVNNSARRDGDGRTRAATIADILRHEIDEGILRPGVKLNEEVLAERFGVSRGPVREALGLLARDDMVRITPHIGAFVTELSVERLPISTMCAPRSFRWRCASLPAAAVLCRNSSLPIAATPCCASWPSA